jgi:hypothetical protein
MARILAAVLVLLLAAAGPALAQGKSNGKGKGNGNHGKPNDGMATEDVVEGVTAGVLGSVLNDDEKNIIRDYFGENPKSAGKVKELPPGIRKKIARGGTMPPGIAKQALPDGLHRRLPPRDGQDYEIVGTDVVLVDNATRVVVDVLKDVLTGN